MSADLEQVLADFRGDVAILRKHKDGRLADAIETVCDAVARSAAPWMTWLSEADAMLQSGKSRDWLRQRFAEWEHEGNARCGLSKARERQYRMCIVPRRRDTEAVKADAVAEARKAS